MPSTALESRLGQDRRMGSVSSGGDRYQEDARAKCEYVRHQIAGILTSAKSGSKGLLLDRDVQDYLKATKDEALYKDGRKMETYAEKLEALLALEQHARDFASEAKQFGEQFSAAIGKAVAEGGLSAASATNLKNKARERGGNWTEVKAFFTKGETDEKGFKKWVRNWEYMAKNLKEIDRRKKQLKLADSDLPALAKLQESSFKNGKYKERRKDMDAALYALAQYEYGEKEMFTRAESELNKAVGEGGLAESKVSRWLANIFDDRKYKGTSRLVFINSTLPKYRSDWVKVRTEFNDLAEECKKLDIPAPTATAFLEELSFKQRKTKVREMHEAVSEATQRVPSSLLGRIDEALKSKNTDAAEDLIEQCKTRAPRDPEIKSRMNSLAALRQGKEISVKGSHESVPDPGAVLEEIWDLLDRVDEPLRSLKIAAMKTQDPQVLRKEQQEEFNRVWIRARGYSDDELEAEEAKRMSNREGTKHRMRRGHTKRMEFNHISGATADKTAISDKCGDFCVPQYTFVENSDAAVAASIHHIAEHRSEEGRSSNSYWTNLIPMTSPGNVLAYHKQEYTVFNINWRLRSAFTKLRGMGVPFQSRNANFKKRTTPSMN